MIQYPQGSPTRRTMDEIDAENTGQSDVPTLADLLSGLRGLDAAVISGEAEIVHRPSDYRVRDVRRPAHTEITHGNVTARLWLRGTLMELTVGSYTTESINPTETLTAARSER